MAQQSEENEFSGNTADVTGADQAHPQIQAQSLAPMPIGAAAGHMPLRSTRRDALLCVVLGLACLALYLLPTGFENRLPDNAVRCRATVLSVDNERVHQYGIVRMPPVAGQTPQNGVCPKGDCKAGGRRLQQVILHGVKQ